MIHVSSNRSNENKLTFLNSMFAWFMVTLTSLDISLILTIHWALKLQKAKQHVYVVHYKEFPNME